MGDEFQHLFQAAAKLKSHQLKSDRPKFEKWPKYKQNSCFQKEEVSALRKLPHGPRLEGLQALKADGNELFKKGDYFGALAKYESALSVVTFAVNAEPDWRNKSIKDSDLTEFDYDGTKTTETTMGTTTLSTAPGSDGQGGADGTVDDVDVDVAQNRAAEVLECKVLCYLNLAAVYLKLKDWPGAIAASTDAISLAPTNAKAHFRRALARLEPLSSGAAEVEQGFHDLKRAAQLDPSNKTVARKLRQVTAQQRAQRERDRKNYSGFLHRPNSKPLYEEKLDNSGAVSHGLEEEHQSNNTTSAVGSKLNGGSHGQQQASAASSATTQQARNGRFGVPEEVEVQFREIEMIIRELEASGDYAKAKLYRDELAQAQEKVKLQAMFQDRPDFENPTPELIAHAKESGIDLTDKAQRDLLVYMQREQLRKEQQELRDDARSASNSSSSDAAPVAAVRAMAEEEAQKRKNSLFWKVFWFVFSLAMCRIFYVLFIKSDGAQSPPPVQPTETCEFPPL